MQHEPEAVRRDRHVGWQLVGRQVELHALEVALAFSLGRKGVEFVNESGESSVRHLVLPLGEGRAVVHEH